MDDVDRFSHLRESWRFEGLASVDAGSWRLQLVRLRAFDPEIIWTLFEIDDDRWLVRRITAAHPRPLASGATRTYGADAVISKELAEDVLSGLAALVIPAFRPSAFGIDGTTRGIRLRRSTGLDTQLFWWEEPEGFTAANEWFEASVHGFDQELPDYSPID